MGKIAKAVVQLASCMLIGIGLAACSSSQLKITPSDAVTTTATIAVTVTDSPQSPTPSVTPAPTLTPTLTGTASPVPPAPPSLSPTPSSLPPTPSPVLPTLTPTALACLSQPGRIETGSLTSGYLPDPLTFHIYLPPCYNEQSGRRFPVLYLLHGQYYTDDQWIRLGAPKTSDALIAGGEVAPFLIVMPRDQVWKRPSKDPFGQALVEELLPWMDTHYRTLPGREDRAIGGLSRGAAWAVHLGLLHWELFGAVGAHSLPVFLEDELDIEDWINQVPIETFPRVYLDIGDHDNAKVLESAVWFEELLTKSGVPHEWHLFSGEHDESYWYSHVEQYLRWYAAEW